jgi:hypothetical protein
MVRIALICQSPAIDGGEMSLPMLSYGIHRIHAAALTAPSPVPRAVHVFDLGHSSFAEVSKGVSKFGPDLIGISAASRRRPLCWTLPIICEHNCQM